MKNVTKRKLLELLDNCEGLVIKADYNFEDEDFELQGFFDELNVYKRKDGEPQSIRGERTDGARESNS